MERTECSSTTKTMFFIVIVMKLELRVVFARNFVWLEIQWLGLIQNYVSRKWGIFITV